MIELDEDKPKPKVLPVIPKKRRKYKRRKTKRKSSAAMFQPSEAKKEATAKRIRDEAGKLLGKRQLRFDITYDPDQQLYFLKTLSGNGELNLSEQGGGMPRITSLFERNFKRWRANLQ